MQHLSGSITDISPQPRRTTLHYSLRFPRALLYRDALIHRHAPPGPKEPTFTALAQGSQEVHEVLEEQIINAKHE